PQPSTLSLHDALPICPPMVSRALAIVHTAIFDAWAAYHPEAVGTRYGAALRRPAAEHTLANKTEAISYAAYRVLVDLYPAQIERSEEHTSELQSRFDL